MFGLFKNKYDARDVIQDDLTDQEIYSLQALKPAANIIANSIKDDGLSIEDAKSKYSDLFLTGLNTMYNMGELNEIEYKSLLAGCKTLVRKTKKKLPLIRDINKDRFSVQVIIYSCEATIDALNSYFEKDELPKFEKGDAQLILDSMEIDYELARNVIEWKFKPNKGKKGKYKLYLEDGANCIIPRKVIRELYAFLSNNVELIDTCEMMKHYGDNKDFKIPYRMVKELHIHSNKGFKLN